MATFANLNRRTAALAVGLAATLVRGTLNYVSGVIATSTDEPDEEGLHR